MALERGGGASGTGTPVNIPDAASDGLHYGRKNDAWVQTNAADTTNTPSGAIAATTVQNAINELDTEKQPLDAELTALAGLTSAADKGIQFTGSGTAAVYDLTAAGKALLDDADATAQRVTLGLVIGTNVQAYDAELAAIAGLTSAADKGIQFTGAGTAATFDLTAAGKALLDDAAASNQRTTLGLVIGTDVQAYDAELAAIAGLTSAADKGIQFTGSGTAAVYDLTAAGKALLDDANAAAQLVTLGLTATAAELNIMDGVTATAAELNALDGITATVTELNYTDGVTSAIQAQIDALVVGSNAYIHLRDEKADGTQGGASTSTTEHVRVLNTEVTDTNNLCSLASNQFTLTAGTYRILASAPCLGGGDHRTYLYNATGAVTLIQGENEYSGAVATETVQTRSWTRGQFTVAASQALELRHRIQTGVAVNGLGAVCNGSGVEVYAQVELWKVG